SSQLVSGVGLGILLMVLLTISGVLAQRENQLNHFDLAYIQKMREYGAATTGSGVKVEGDLRTSQGFGAAVAVGSAHLVVAPFPWQMLSGSLRRVLVIPEVVLWWFVFFKWVIPGLWCTVRHHFSDVLPLLCFILGMGLLYSLMFNNIGQIYRFRAQLLPWLFI